MSCPRATVTSGRRLLLLAVAAFLSLAAALAIGILLFGDFGATEGRILGTTALLAGYGLLALPAAILQDRRRLPALVAVVGVLVVAGAGVSVAAMWWGEPPEAVGKAIGTVNGWLVAAVQVAALALRRRERDRRSVRVLYAVSSALVVTLAALLTVALWAQVDSEAFGRVFGALVVLDVLLVALQPILARARPTGIAYRLRVSVAPGKVVDLVLEAPDLGAATMKAIRTLEADGRRVVGVEFTDVKAEASSAATAQHRPEAALADESRRLDAPRGGR